MLKNKIIIITGGAGLIGQEFVKSIVFQGGTAVIADINETLSNQMVKELKEKSGNSRIDFFLMDITSKESIEIFIKSVKNKYGHIDAVVNNAYPRNKNYGRKFEDVEYLDFCENVNLHLGGYFLVCQRFVDFFKTQGYGNIINISSIYGLIAPRFDVYEDTTMTMPVEYAAIKSAIIHMTKYIAKYLKGLNIRINSLSLGGILDNQPVAFIQKYNKYSLNKGMLNQKDITGSLIYLLSDNSIFVNGQNIVVDDGWSL